MRPIYFQAKMSAFQERMYERIEVTSKFKGKFLSLPCTLIELLSPPLRTLVGIVESVAFIALNLLGVLINSKKCSVRHALYSAGYAAGYALLFPITVLAGTLSGVAALFCMLRDSQAYAATNAEYYRIQGDRINAQLLA